MLIHFYKYHGTGNDFVMIDNRNESFPKDNTDLVTHLCHRRFGIGADGLILLENAENYDFKMVYYNSDGNESTMCGNGGRSIVAFAKDLGIISDKAFFTAIDGEHHASINTHRKITLQMQDVHQIITENDYTFLNTGSPHHVLMVENTDEVDVKKEGSAIRYGKLYQKKGGTNVNFVTQIDDHNFRVRTYERGVEDETYSCGTGVTAVAIAMFENKITDKNTVTLHTPGGILNVSFKKNNDGYSDIFLKWTRNFCF